MRIRSNLSNVAARTPALAVIGTWDPVVEAHQKLFRKIARRAKRVNLTPVVIILHPSPVKLLNPRSKQCFEYSDIKSRVLMIRESAPVEVLVIHFRTDDLDASCRDFFDLLGSRLDLRELWLGAGQSLGRGAQGSDAAIATLARKRHILLRRMKPSHEINVGATTLRLIDQGKVRDAVACAGHPPVWERPRSGFLRLSWPSGKYMVAPLTGSSLEADLSQILPIRLVPAVDGRKRQSKWPDKQIRRLAIVAGPADC
jgi:FAD synthase